MAPAQVLIPVARWSQMAAPGAAICNMLSQLWNVITSVSKSCRAWQPSLSDQAGSGGCPKTVTHIGLCQAWKRQPTLASKPRGHITRCAKQRYQWPHLCPSEFLRNYKNGSVCNNPAKYAIPHKLTLFYVYFSGDQDYPLLLGCQTTNWQRLRKPSITVELWI